MDKTNTPIYHFESCKDPEYTLCSLFGSTSSDIVPQDSSNNNYIHCMVDIFPENRNYNSKHKMKLDIDPMDNMNRKNICSQNTSQKDTHSNRFVYCTHIYIDLGYKNSKNYPNGSNHSSNISYNYHPFMFSTLDTYILSFSEILKYFFKDF